MRFITVSIVLAAAFIACSSAASIHQRDGLDLDILDEILNGDGLLDTLNKRSAKNGEADEDEQEQDEEEQDEQGDASLNNH
ncbi:hypothetical protein EDC96DRAFT_509254 [Choanephora cucurbitarum]|nr:hypothetical protein EDC96DRAFT_521934 [Choanephora cucurbitarum]KAI8344912.1 hypothetical protein EDC96DRAFT_521946 [Choanephora cucurbitarum]KAI8365608.1 hypothetical protein EDC96DRAFT_509254 [Choanephora cucurbitarum]